MIGGTTELIAFQGRSFSYNIKIEQDTNNAPFDLQNGTLRGYIKKSYYSSVVSAQFTISVLDSDNGIINIELFPNDTKDLFPQRYVYDIIIEYDSGVSYPILNGILYIYPSVTL